VKNFRPYFKQCFFRGWVGGALPPQAESNTTPPSPKTEITNILFYILNFASIIKFVKCNFSLTFYHNKKQKPPLQIYRPRQLPSLPRPKFAPAYSHRFCMVWCVVALEQVLVWDSFTVKHGQLQTVTVTDSVQP
jgi:hypothetical protein